MEIRFDGILYFNLCNENSDAGHIKCSPGPQVPHHWSMQICYFFLTCVVASARSKDFYVVVCRRILRLFDMICILQWCLSDNSFMKSVLQMISESSKIKSLVFSHSTFSHWWELLRHYTHHNHIRLTKKRVPWQVFANFLWGRELIWWDLSCVSEFQT